MEDCARGSLERLHAGIWDLGQGAGSKVPVLLHGGVAGCVHGATCRCLSLGQACRCPWPGPHEQAQAQACRASLQPRRAQAHARRRATHLHTLKSRFSQLSRACSSVKVRLRTSGCVYQAAASATTQYDRPSLRGPAARRVWPPEKRSSASGSAAASSMPKRMWSRKDCASPAVHAQGRQAGGELGGVHHLESLECETGPMQQQRAEASRRR